MVNKENVYIIIPVHNRKDITIKCLDTLQQNGDLDKYYIVVVDDGSTDGTSEVIKSLYPDVIILMGNGNLWWTGAIAMGMKHAYEHGAEYLIWLNDDCYPQERTIAKLINTCQLSKNVIVGAQSLDSDTLQPSYGGVVTKWLNIIEISALEGNIQECDGLNGNLVCIPRIVIKDIGYPNFKIFPQYHGDTTYTKQAKKCGYRLLIQGDAITFCTNDHPKISWLNPNKPIIFYWKDYFKIGSPHYWKSELNYYKEMFGISGIGLYIYQKIIRFWLFVIFVTVTPVSLRQFLKRVKA